MDEPRFNSVATICFTIEHEKKDGSDITGEQLSRALTLRRRDLDRDGDLSWEEACLPVGDTFDNQEPTPMKYRVSASVTIEVICIPIEIDSPPKLGRTIEHAVADILDKRMVILDTKGGRSGEAGIINVIQAQHIEVSNIIEE